MKGKLRWLTTVVASAAVSAPISTQAMALPPDRLAWALARPPALPEFGYTDPWQAPQGDGNRAGRLFRFDIPAGSVGAGVDAVAAVTGLRVSVARNDLRGLAAGRVSGLMTVEQALTTLLADTGISFHFTAADAVLLDIRTAESVTVSSPRIALTSPKFVEPVRDTPKTVTVIPAHVLQQQSAATLRDALRNTPGITLTAGEGGNAPGDNVLIRGFSARNDVYVDGARDPGVVTRDTFNTEAVEVAKGPSSSISGRGATGGSVNIVTKMPTLRNAFSAVATGGSAESGRLTADGNLRVSDNAALRLNLMWRNEGTPRRDEIRNRSWGVAPSLSLGLGTPTDVTFSYQHLDQHNVPDYGLPGTLPQQAVDRGLTIADLDFSNFYGLVSRDYEKMRSDLGTVVVRHQFAPSFSLRNLTRYGRNDLDRVVTAPRAATAAASAADPGFNPSGAQVRRTDAKYQVRTDATLVNQTDLTLRGTTGPVSHVVSTGVELSRDRQPSRALTDAFNSGRPPVTDLLNPDPSQPYLPSLVPTGASTVGTSRTVAAYAFDTMKIGDRWQADLGLRWDRVSAQYDTVAATGVRADFERVDRAPSGHAALLFKPSPAGSLYASYATSFNPAFDGTFGLALTAATAPLAPEKTHNIEAGVKWEIGRALATAAVFHNEKTNARTINDAGAAVLAGDQTVRGVEVSLSGQLTDRWSALAGLAVMRSRVNESGVPAEVGRQLSYVPRTTFNLWSSYRPSSRLTLGGGAQFTDGYFFNNTNALTTANLAAMQRLTRYWLFNAMGSFAVNRHLALQVNGTNLSGARYIDRGYTGHVIPGAGRGILVGPVFTF
jgi:catecholate siderophore receptor